MKSYKLERKFCNLVVSRDVGLTWYLSYVEREEIGVNKQKPQTNQGRESEISLRGSACRQVEANDSEIPRKMQQTADFQTENVGSEFMR